MDAVSNSTQRYDLPPLSPAVSAMPNGSLRVIFGRTKMTSQQLAALSVGDVVELDEQAESPVDIVRGDQILARAIPIEQKGELAWRVVEVLEQAFGSSEVTP